jgi:hypothetical protein
MLVKTRNSTPPLASIQPFLADGKEVRRRRRRRGGAGHVDGCVPVGRVLWPLIVITEDERQFSIQEEFLRRALNVPLARHCDSCYLCGRSADKRAQESFCALLKVCMEL